MRALQSFALNRPSQNSISRITTRSTGCATTVAAALTVYLIFAPPAAASTFFDSHGTQARCSALSDWIKRTVRDAGGPSISQMEKGPELQAKLAPAFQDEIFVPFFGRSFFSLDSEEKRTAQRAFSGCFPGDRFVRGYLTIPFNYEERTFGDTYRSFMDEIQRLRRAATPRNSPDALSTATESSRPTRAPNVMIGGKSKLLTTDRYTVYGGFGCDADVVLARDDQMFGEPLFELAHREIIPAVHKHPTCIRVGARSGSLKFYWDSVSFFYENSRNPATGEYETRLVMVEPSDDPGMKNERPVYLLSYSQQAGGEGWRFREYYFDYLIYHRGGVLYDGNPALDSMAMIKRFAADPRRAELSESWKQEGQEAARMQWRRKMEEAREQKLRKARVDHRKRAAPILAMLPGSTNELPPVNFSPYQNGDLMEDIYHGRFAEFVGNHEPGDEISNITNAASALNDDGGIGAIWYHLGRQSDMTQRRAPLILAFKAYHEAYASACADSRSMPWSTLTFQRDWVTRNRHGVEITRIEGEPETVNVRKPFVEAFSEAHSFYSDPGIFAAGAIKPSFAEFGQQLRSDFSTFLTSFGCNSAPVRFFEINLYLADRWLLPIQELQP